MMRLDGSAGEGGGQILRTALGLSIVTGVPFRIDTIRARRKNPGLQRQHLAAVKAAARVGSAEVNGAAIGSQVLTFVPHAVCPGHHRFDVGSAGSAMLVLQTVLPALMTAPEPSELVLEGGTHNPWAPPFDFVEKAFLPLLARMGAHVRSVLERRGFYPVGGGCVRIGIEPAAKLGTLDLHARGDVRAIRATAIVSRLPSDIARRELAVLGQALSLGLHELRAVEDRDAYGPGNIAFVEIESDGATEVFTGFGRKGVRAETVAEKLAGEVRRYLDEGAPVGEYLADQLLVPLALAGSGGFTAGSMSSHAETNVEVISKFLPVRFSVSKSPEGQTRVSL